MATLIPAMGSCVSRMTGGERLEQKHDECDPLADTIKVLTMHATKRLEFPVLALMGQVPVCGRG
jgi:superfamily I DNA/RNA helicase